MELFRFSADADNDLMSVSQAQVFWAYRVLLGREPESLEAVNHHLSNLDFESLLQSFLRSEEFGVRVESLTICGQGDRPVSGLYQDVETIDIEVDCTLEQRELMLTRIAEEWRKFGETEPHWSVLTNDLFRAGSIDSNLDTFYSSGLESVEVLLCALRRAGKSTLMFHRIMDFGCGVGRLTLALAQYADQVVGIDISLPHIKIAEERAAHVALHNVSFELLTGIQYLDKFSGLDLIISMIVLQHNPPPVMAVLFGKLLSALKVGGFAIIQMPTYLEGQRFSVEDYLKNKQQSMEMNMLPQKVVFEIIDRAGCRVLEVREDGAIGPIGVSQTFAIQRVR